MPDNSAFGVAQPEEAQTFEQWFSDNYPGMNGGNPYGYDNVFFQGFYKNVKNQYDTYLANLENRNESIATQAANQWAAQREDTYYQRAIRDLEKAGINPYILVNEGSIGSSSASSATKASYNSPRGNDKSFKTGESGRNVALLLLAAARLVAALV